ncbi:MAG: hypothetical protein U9Q78_09155 [Chloroflexota bacterium]|nr:hypothetical protein [Chloroflexota bacterium]
MRYKEMGMEGWSLIIAIIGLALLGFVLLIGALILVLRFSQRWIDEYYAKKGKGRTGPSAAELYRESLKEKKD